MGSMRFKKNLCQSLVIVTRYNMSEQVLVWGTKKNDISLNIRKEHLSEQHEF